MRSWKIWVLILAAASILPVAAALQTYPRSELSFDTGSNGLWVGHKWYTGRGVQTGARVSPEEVEQLAERLRSFDERRRYLSDAIDGLPGIFLTINCSIWPWKHV